MNRKTANFRLPCMAQKRRVLRLPNVPLTVTSAFCQGPIGPDGIRGKDGDQVSFLTLLIFFFFSIYLNTLGLLSFSTTAKISIILVLYARLASHFPLRCLNADFILFSRVVQDPSDNMASQASLVIGYSHPPF